MDKYTNNLLTVLKKQFFHVVGDKDFQNIDDMHAFYLDKLEDNLYMPMSVSAEASYKQGSGKELDDKMKALRSSSALTYNLFWDQIGEIINADNKILTNGIYSVELEKQYHTLKTSKAPANLDAFLYCKHTEEAIAVEMKMMEWLLNKPGKLKAAYLDPKNYFDANAGLAFASAAKALIEPTELTADAEELKEYTSRFHHYDAFQMFKHTVACYTACMVEEPRPIKKLTLVNCIWTLPNSDLLDEKFRERYICDERAEVEEFKQFKTAMAPIKQLFADEGIDFNICFYTFTDFLQLFKKTPAELDYLRRYTFK